MIVADFRASSLGWSDAAAQIEQLAQRDRDAALDMLADACSVSSAGRYDWKGTNSMHRCE